MANYGTVIQGTLTRGKIRNTDIENGTRYVQLMNVEKSIPSSVKWGRFWIRVFCDNNETECGYCGETSHPYYKCPVKAEKQQQCYKCLQKGHVAWQCKNDVVCSLCLKSGHVKKQCVTVVQKPIPQHENDEDKTEKSLEDETDDEDVLASPVFEKKNSQNKTVENNSSVGKHLILGASLVNYIEINNANVETCSVSGASMELVHELIEQTEAKSVPETVQQVVVHLGTNDVSKHPTDVGQIIINYSIGINTIKDSFPNAKLFLFSIPPRKGKSDNIRLKNETTTTVNRYIKRLAENDEKLAFVNTHPVLTDITSGSPIKRLYDNRDNNGIHLSLEGKKVLKASFLSVLQLTEEKRKQTCTTPSSVEKPLKIKK